MIFTPKSGIVKRTVLLPKPIGTWPGYPPAQPFSLHMFISVLVYSCYFLFCFWDMVLCIPDWPQIHYTVEKESELLTLLPSTSECLYYRHEQPHLLYEVLRIKSKDSYKLGEHSTNWTTSPPPLLLWLPPGFQPISSPSISSAFKDVKNTDYKPGSGGEHL